MGNKKWEIRNRKYEMGNGKWEVQVMSYGKFEIGSMKSKIQNPMLSATL